MRIRPVVASIAMLGLLAVAVGVWGGGWLHALVAVAVACVLAVGMHRLYRGMWDDETD